MKKLLGIVLIAGLAGCGGPGAVTAPENPVTKPADLKIEGSSGGGGSSSAGSNAMSEGLK